MAGLSGGEPGRRESAPLPALIAGESNAEGVAVAPGEVAATDQETKPPPRITEARLLSLMENAGRQVEDDEVAAVLNQKGSARRRPGPR